MQVSKVLLVFALLVLLLLFLGTLAALTFDSDFGEIEVSTVSIKGDEFTLDGLLYKPKSASSDTAAPAVVLAHGIGSSKEMMSSLGLELARNGFVSLCIDLYGHGESEGAVADGRRESSFGVCSAIKYLKSQPYVNSSALMLLGHSLGAGAVRAATQSTDAVALILIAGGLGEAADVVEYAEFNSTFPRNLLVIVGKYDILLDTDELLNNVLPPVFGLTGKVVPSLLYGNFSSQTARKFVLPLTTHLFEPLDSTVIAESISWFGASFGNPQNPKQFVYLQREFSIFIALIGILGVPLLAFHIIQVLTKKSNLAFIDKAGLTCGKWRLYLVWGVINLVLFIPLFIIGLGISFPPLIFGSSVAWWLFVSGLIGLLLLAKFPERIISKKLQLKKLLACSCTKYDVITATSAFLIIFAVTSSFSLLLPFNFRIVTPILTSLSSIRRVLAFTTFIPFFLPYFIAEGIYLHELAQKKLNEGVFWTKIRLSAEKAIGKIAPIAIVLSLQYLTKVTLDFWLFPGFLGFLFEFLWLIIPIFAIAVVFSSWFYEKSGNIFSGAFFNTLLLAWIASATFPF